MIEPFLAREIRCDEPVALEETILRRMNHLMRRTNTGNTGAYLFIVGLSAVCICNHSA